MSKVLMSYYLHDVILKQWLNVQDAQTWLGAVESAETTEFPSWQSPCYTSPFGARGKKLQQDWAIPLLCLSSVGLSSCDVCCNQGIVGLCFLCHLYNWGVSHVSVLGVNVMCCLHSTPDPCTVNMPKVNLPQSSCSCWTQHKSEWSSVGGSESTADLQ